MTSKPASSQFIKRMLSSLIAIAAVSTIFGAKAFEISHAGKPDAIAYAESGAPQPGAN